MISTNQFKNGMTIDVDGETYLIVDFQHVKPGKGGAFVRTKLKKVKSGAVIDKTFRAGEKVEQARLTKKQSQYLYNTGSEFIFMDQTTFEQIELNKDKVGSAIEYLKENMQVTLLDIDGEIFGIDLPITVDLAVTQTSPGVKGDTVSGGTKVAEVETGAKVNVPLFIEIGDVVKIDTRNGLYVTRV